MLLSIYKEEGDKLRKKDSEPLVDVHIKITAHQQRILQVTEINLSAEVRKWLDKFIQENSLAESTEQTG